MIFASGCNKRGQLGTGNDEIRETIPTPLTLLRGKKVCHVSCGEQHSAILTDLGDVYTFGRGVEGQLGLGDRCDSKIPAKVNGLRHERIVKTACGNHHTLALSSTGQLYQWGKLHRLAEDASSDVLGQLVNMHGLASERKKAMIEQSLKSYLSGDLKDEDQVQLMKSFTSFVGYMQTTPLLVEELIDHRIVDMSAGYAFTIVVTDKGRVLSYGFNDKGQLGLGHRFNQDRPQLLKDLFNIKSVSCGQQHVLALSENGEVYSWGLNVFGQLGQGTERDRLVPNKIRALEGENIVKIDCGAHHSVAISSSGQCFSFGHGEYGQHGGLTNYGDWGTGEKGKENSFYGVPRPIVGLGACSILACGTLHNCAITSTGECYTWGWGASGCLGHGDARFQLIPKLVESVQGESIFAAACGWKHTLWVKSGTNSSFAFDFQKLVNNSLFSDHKFIIGDKTFFAHKPIVFARCAHLKAICSLAFRYANASPNETIIDGVTPALFLGLLNFLYTDHIIIAPHLVGRLGILGRKYGLRRLYLMCARNQTGNDPNDSLGVPDSKFGSDMKQMVDSEHYSDLSFQIGNHEIYAHRCVLMARNEYFRRMFQSDFMESTSPTLKVDEDISVTTFRTVLEFIYTGNTELITEENVIDLLQPADEYAVEELKQRCEALLEDALCEENAAWVLEAGDRYGCPRLKRAAIEYIISSKETLHNVCNSDTFVSLQTSSPSLVRELDHKSSIKGLCNPGELLRWKRKN